MLTKSFFKHCCSHKGSLVLVLAMTASHIGSAAASVPDDEQSRKPPYDWAVWKFLSSVKAEPRLVKGDVVKLRFIAADGGVKEIPPLKIDTSDKQMYWTGYLMYPVSQANIGIKMGAVDGAGRYGGGTRVGELLHFYDTVPGTFVKAITEIHHVNGGVTVVPELATRDEPGSLTFLAPSQAKRGSNFTVRAGIGKGKAGWLQIVVIDAAVGEVIMRSGVRVDEVVKNFELTPGAESKGPLMLLATAELDGDGLWDPTPQIFKAVELYDFAFPDAVASYKAGVKVLQPKDNALYECRPFPAGDYCRQWSATDVQFEPGTGSNWRDAWIRLP